MINKKNQRKSQAAIEFLMTYGWMILVVLIVGALIFSFVDFDSLLPSQVGLNPPLRGDGTLISASAAEKKISFVIAYIGSKSSSIEASEIKLISDNGFTCHNNQKVNITKVSSGVTIISDDADSDDLISVINGDLVRVDFECSTGDLVKGDVFEGETSFKIKDTRSKFITTSKGRIRVGID